MACSFCLVRLKGGGLACFVIREHPAVKPPSGGLTCCSTSNPPLTLKVAHFFSHTSGDRKECAGPRVSYKHDMPKMLQSLPARSVALFGL